MNKWKRFVIVIVCLQMLQTTAYTELNTVKVYPDIDFQSALEECREALSIASGIPVEEIAKMEYEWKGTPRYLLVPSDEPYYTQSDASWYIDIEYGTEDGKRYRFIFRTPMLNTGKDDGFCFLADITGGKDDPLRVALEESYQKHYGGMDEETVKMESEMGPYFLWTYEEKAAFYKKWNMQPYHHDDYVSGIYLHEQWLLPDQTDLQYGDVSVMADEIVKETFQLSDEIMKALYTDVRFYKWSDDDGDPRWKIQYWMYADCGGVVFWEPVCIVTISRDGREQWCSLY